MTRITSAVRIVESPVESIEIEDVSVFLGDGSRQEEWQDGELLGTWMEYYVLPRHITVTLKDGTVIEGLYTAGEASANSAYMGFTVSNAYTWGRIAGENAAEFAATK